MDASEIYSQLLTLREELSKLTGITMADDDLNRFRDPEAAMMVAMAGISSAIEAITWMQSNQDTAAEIIYLPDAVAIEYPAHGGHWFINDEPRP